MTHETLRPQSQSGQTVIINQTENSNGMGTAGFVLALIAVFLGWVPFLGWIIWLLGHKSPHRLLHETDGPILR